MKALENIRRANPLSRVLGCRVGTLVMSRDELEAAVGKPSAEYGPEYFTNSLGDVVEDSPKVTVTWIFTCPRGNFEIRDYWWNAKNEWSIAADGKAALWARAYCRRLGKRFP